jgi:tryptophanyl-tRNA synthetase
MRPTGKLHLGNYMGALANWVKLQDAYECYFFIADYHALTTDYADPSRVKLNTIDVALDWLAAGLDPAKSRIFIQSHVPQHAELHLLFSMITPLGWLERVPTYKDQQENLTAKDLTTYGFLGYPLLQSADILLYQPRYVPVGQDQVAHVELTREVARRFNSLYRCTVFPEPEVLLTPSPKLTGTDGRKMSKSYGNTIGLTESPKSVETKILSMSTNGQRAKQTDAGNPELCPVADLHKAFSPDAVAEEWLGNCRNARGSCAECRRAAASSVKEHTAPFFERRQKYERDIAGVWEMLREESRKAEVRAEETMVEARKVLDLSRELTGEESRKIQKRMATPDFGASDEDRIKSNSLDGFSDLWKLPSDLQSKQIREFWRSTIIPYDVSLSQEGNRTFASLDRELEEPFVTSKKKRLLLGTPAVFEEATPQYPDGWHFLIPPRSYEVWTLICLDREANQLYDFVIPQHVYAQYFAQAKRALKKDESIHVIVRKTNSGWKLSFVDLKGRDEAQSSIVITPFEPVDINGFLSNYQPLR